MCNGKLFLFHREDHRLQAIVALLFRSKPKERRRHRSLVERFLRLLFCCDPFLLHWLLAGARGSRASAPRCPEANPAGALRAPGTSPPSRRPAATTRPLPTRRTPAGRPRGSRPGRAGGGGRSSVPWGQRRTGQWAARRGGARAPLVRRLHGEGGGGGAGRAGGGSSSGGGGSSSSGARGPGSPPPTRGPRLRGGVPRGTGAAERVGVARGAERRALPRCPSLGGARRGMCRPPGARRPWEARC